MGATEPEHPFTQYAAVLASSYPLLAHALARAVVPRYGSPLVPTIPDPEERGHAETALAALLAEGHGRLHRVAAQAESAEEFVRSATRDLWLVIHETFVLGVHLGGVGTARITCPCCPALGHPPRPRVRPLRRRGRRSPPDG